MTIAATTSIELGHSDAKKDAVVTTGIPTLTDDSVAIWTNDIPAPNTVQSTVGQIHALHRAAADLLKTGNVAFWISSTVGAGENDVTFIAPIAGEVGVYFGTDVAADGQTHHADRTVKRLIERYLEEAKDGVA